MTASNRQLEPLAPASFIRYTIGDATRPQGDGRKVIAHICNDEGKWGAGFVLAISKRWKEPELQYREWSRQVPPPQLGAVQFVDVEPGLTVANMIGQHGIRRGKGGTPPIRYEAVELALQRCALYAAAHQATVHMPRIGCGLAGGEWARIEPIIKEQLATKGIETFVYDLT